MYFSEFDLMSIQFKHSFQYRRIEKRLADAILQLEDERRNTEQNKEQVCDHGFLNSNLYAPFLFLGNYHFLCCRQKEKKLE